LRKYVKFIVLVLITIAIFWFFGRNLDWQEISAALRKANPYYLGLAFLGICLGYFLRAVRWQVLLSPIVGAKIRDLFATTTVGFTAILFVGRAGEIVRPMWLPMRDKRIRPSAALVTIFVERVFDLASLMAFFSISLMFFRTPEGRETEFASIKLAGNIIVAIIVAGIIGMIIYHRYSAQIIDWVEAFTDRQFVPKRVRYVFLSLMRNMATALDILKRPREIILAAFWTTALWVAIAIPILSFFMSFDLPITLFDLTFVMGVASLGTLIPTPGGAAGAFHAATAGSLIILGVDREQAAAVSIIMHLIYFAPALVFGLYYLFHGDISIERFRSLLSSENAEKEIESDSPDFEKVNSEK